MARLNTKLSFLHCELPKSILSNIQRSPLAKYGTLKGIAKSVRNIKNEKSKRKPKPPPTASSERKSLDNPDPRLQFSSCCTQIFPASMNAAQWTKPASLARYSVFSSSL